MGFPAWMNDLRNKLEPTFMYDGKVILRRERSFYEYNLQNGKTRNVFNVPCGGPVKASILWRAWSLLENCVNFLLTYKSVLSMKY
jgi:hypothetical protein